MAYRRRRSFRRGRGRMVRVRASTLQRLKIRAMRGGRGRGIRRRRYSRPRVLGQRM